MRARIVAEVGANHGGDLGLAEAMVAAAAECGADFVKFQSWQARRLKPGDPNCERHAEAELSDEAHLRLIEACREHGVRFLTTCFDLGRVDFLASLGLEAIKIASPDCGSTELLRRVRGRFPHVIVSTGMSTDAEVEAAARTLEGSPFTFMHCVSLYPTPPERVNLARMDWLGELAPAVGFSDHTLGTAAPCAAIARGASLVEKHFTLTRRLPGKDQAVSCEPDELRAICEFARVHDRMVGQAHPKLSDEERRLRDVYVGKWGDNR